MVLNNTRLPCSKCMLVLLGFRQSNNNKKKNEHIFSLTWCFLFSSFLDLIFRYVSNIFGSFQKRFTSD